jgi:hypothetical protein
MLARNSYMLELLHIGWKLDMIWKKKSASQVSFSGAHQDSKMGESSKTLSLKSSWIHQVGPSSHFNRKRFLWKLMNMICEFPADGKDFDLILKAPFPNIEILRWEPPHCRDREAIDKDDLTKFDQIWKQLAVSSIHNDSLLSQAKNWYTLDNRRLYCLQRMAAEHLGAHCLPASSSCHGPGDSRWLTVTRGIGRSAWVLLLTFCTLTPDGSGRSTTRRRKDALWPYLPRWRRATATKLTNISKSFKKIKRESFLESVDKDGAYRCVQ